MTLFSRLHEAATSAARTASMCLGANGPGDAHDGGPAPFQLPPAMVDDRPGDRATDRPLQPRRTIDYGALFDGTADQHARRAAIVADDDWLRYAIVQGADLNAVSRRNGDSLFMRAIVKSQHASRYLLLQTMMHTPSRGLRPIDLTHLNNAGNNAVHLAAADPDASMLLNVMLAPLLHLDNGYTLEHLQHALDTPDRAGHTPIQIADATGRADGAYALVAFRQHLNARRGTEDPGTAGTITPVPDPGALADRERSGV